MHGTDMALEKLRFPGTCRLGLGGLYKERMPLLACLTGKRL